MFESNKIIKIFKKGGYIALEEEFGNSRMPKGHYSTLTTEAQLIWIRYLRWRFRQNNPEFIKQQNKYYSEKRKKEKPYKCICKRCGKEFKAQRPYLKLCGKCPTLTEIRKKEVEKRIKEKEKKIRLVAEMYLSGLFTQEEVAQKFGTYQKQVSVWVKSYKNSCKKK